MSQAKPIGETPAHLKAMGIEVVFEVDMVSLMSDGTLDTAYHFEYACPLGHQHRSESDAVRCVEGVK